MRTILISAILGSVALAGSLPVYGGTQFDGKHFPWPRFATPGDVHHINTPTREIETPHLKAAMPYAGGRIKVLFIMPRPGVRPAIEVCQRFDVDERYALIYSGSKLDNTDNRDFVTYAPGLEKELVLAALTAGLEWKPDVICLHAMSWGTLPANVREEILKQVKAGAGLVGWQAGSPDENGFLATVFDAGPADAEATNSILSCVPKEMGYRFSGTRARTVGQAGHAVQLCNKPAEGLFSYLHDEDLYSLAGRSILWAAGRTPRTTMDVSVDQAYCRVKLQGTPVEQPVLTLAIYDPTAVLRHQREYIADVPLDADVRMPHLKTGPHWVRLTLRSGGKVVD